MILGINIISFWSCVHFNPEIMKLIIPSQNNETYLRSVFFLTLFSHIISWCIISLKTPWFHRYISYYLLLIIPWCKISSRTPSVECPVFTHGQLYVALHASKAKTVWRLLFRIQMVIYQTLKCSLQRGSLRSMITYR